MKVDKLLYQHGKECRRASDSLYQAYIRLERVKSATDSGAIVGIVILLSGLIILLSIVFGGK